MGALLQTYRIFVPVMDWTEDAVTQKINGMEGGGRVRVSIIPIKQGQLCEVYVLRWTGKPARDYLKSLQESEFKYEGASADAILAALEKKTKPRSNEISAITKLCSLQQGDMPLSEFIREVRRLAELCNYPNDQERLIRDKIVS